MIPAALLLLKGAMALNSAKNLVEGPAAPLMKVFEEVENTLEAEVAPTPAPSPVTAFAPKLPRPF
ncbi:TPA: hypothetical protein ACK3Q6_002689 [Burkholderia cepacia]|uniref:Uncharacterized protein n=1 Tax=Burkholderia cenocepacia TaxID=95486 RepID=A0ABD4UD56_9BURK|nr:MULTISPECIES: hypothetical protein [Burkholderia]HDR9764136.1 hypothetical protein [Burkholderia cepacia ATCC 25416]MCA8361202.1 hypothetical protein [Burkholderia cepacia]MCW3498651.1 hypothetical protein [Burkholderia cenocepacia]MCW3506261.1 hypothetical protein [Burkholderia cenocepacia]MCW3513804.1 hypothetical protein [Burkholderia cenocepacia]